MHVRQDLPRRAVVTAGRRFMPPGERPSTGVGPEMGVSDPACSSYPRPRARSAGSLTPHDVSVGDVLGRAFDRG